MKHLWLYLLLSLALHLGVGWLLREFQAKPDPLAWQPPMAIQLVSLAPVLAPKASSEPPRPMPVKTQPAAAKTSPRPEARPSQPVRPPAHTASQSVATSQTASSIAAPPPRLTPVVSLRPSFVTPPPAPRYPSVARRRNQQGIVRVEVQLDERGQQQKLTLTGSSGVASLDQAALDAVKNWRFRPEIVDGRAVPSRVEIPIEFALTANR